jgi:hypothetical protein
MGAILFQTDDQGEKRVISYPIKKLVKHEKNYTPSDCTGGLAWTGKSTNICNNVINAKELKGH